MLTTGLLGANRTTSVSVIASITPGPATASSSPICTNDRAVSLARCSIHHCSKWITRCPLAASGSSTTTWVSQRCSVIGSIRTPGFHRSHRAAVTSARP